MKKRSILSILTLYFITLILLITGVISVLFAFIQYHTYKTSAVNELNRTCTSVGENIDLQINQLDSVVLGAINSAALTDALTEYLRTEPNSYKHLELRQRISALLTQLKGFEYSIRQINIYSIGDMGYGVGDHIGELENYEKEDWYKKTLDEKGKKYVHSVNMGKEYLSIARAYYDSYHRMCGVMEGRKYYDEVFHAAKDKLTQYEAKVVIYNEKGDVIYTSDENSQQFDYFSHYSGTPAEIRNGISGKMETVSFYRADYSKFVVVMAVENSLFLRQIYRSLLPVVLLFICASIAGSLLAFYISKSLSTPIRTIYDFLSSKKGLLHNERLELEPTGILEVDQLTSSINEYLDRSDEQTTKIVTLHEQEIQAQMLALQSQMNPHFLYNSLASIAEMAREGLTDQVKTMTVNISQILRYISSNREQVTTIEEELELCDMYLECMKLRFGDDLIYEFDVADEMLEYMIPKLCIQLLVENAIKSVTTKHPVWRIRVYGYIDGENWYIEVQDNGPGWDPEVDKKLRSQMDGILETRTLPSLKIEGMGVLNIFIRFYLLDGITFLFDFGNRSEGGAFVKVGRRIPAEPAYEE